MNYTTHTIRNYAERGSERRGKTGKETRAIGDRLCFKDDLNMKQFILIFFKTLKNQDPPELLINLFGSSLILINFIVVERDMSRKFAVSSEDLSWNIWSVLRDYCNFSLIHEELGLVVDELETYDSR